MKRLLQCKELWGISVCVAECPCDFILNFDGTSPVFRPFGYTPPSSIQP